jgi:D-alanyl-lipoteichoic acid acyltransferase DltB (MBOAT superfamily)
MGARVWLACLGLALGLALAEGAARLTGDWLCADVPGVVLASDPDLGWRQRPNLHGWAAFCRGKSIPPTPVATDARGFLNPGRPIEKPPGTARILMLGGNVPQAFGVPWRLSIAGMLEGRADARRGRPLEVVNGAMGSFTLDQDLRLLRAEGAPVAPDLVLVVADPVVETTAMTPELIALASLRAPAKPYFDAIDGALVPRETPPPEPPPAGPPVAAGPLASSALYRLLRGLPRDAGTPHAWLPVQPIPMEVSSEQAHGDRVLRAVLAALRDETARLGARLALVFLPPPREPRPREATPTHRMLGMAHELGIPATSLSLQFRTLGEHMGNTGYIDDTTRFNADGHFAASASIWNFLESEHLLPPGVASIRAPGGGRVAPFAPFPGAPLAALRMELTGGIVRVVAASLVAVVLVWLAAPLPARARDWTALAASLVPIGLLTGARGAGAGLAFALAFALVAELRRAWLRRPLTALLATTLVALPVAWLARLPTDRSVPLRLYVGFASVMAVLRGVAYVTERRRLRTRPELVDVLLGFLFFPTFVAGPIQSVWSLAHARAHGTLAVATGADVVRHLRGAAWGALCVACGLAKLLVAPMLLNLLTPDVIASSGDALGRARLWLWLLETSVYLWALYSGWSDVGTGLAAMVGVRTPTNFRRPWAAPSPIEFWSRALVTVTVRFRRLVCRPVARRVGMAAGMLAALAAGALWHACSVLALFGAFGTRPGAWAGLAMWAVAHTLAGLVVDRRRLAGLGAVGRMLGVVATQLLVALAWVPFVAFPFGTLGTIMRIYARLLGLR